MELLQDGVKMTDILEVANNDLSILGKSNINDFSTNSLMISSEPHKDFAKNFMKVHPENLLPNIKTSSNEE